MKTLCTFIFALFVVFSVNAQWEFQNSSTTMSLNSVYFLDTEMGYAVGDSGIVLRTINGGNTWVIQQSGTNMDLLDVFFIDANEGWVVGGIVTTYTFLGIILHTSNGGISWEEQYNPGVGSNPIRSVHFIDSDNGWAAGGTLSYYGIGVILQTIDGGVNWDTLATPDLHQYTDVYFFDQDIGWAVGCQQWGSGIMDHTSDGGDTWDLQATTANKLYSICSTDPDNAWAVGFHTPIIHTSDGGLIWEEQTEEWYLLNQIYFSDSHHGWAVGSESTILHTSDGGQIWEFQESGTLATLNSVCFVDQNVGWICGDSGVILHIENGGIFGVSEMGEEVSTLKLFPNPTSNYTSLCIELKEKSHIALSLYAFGGQQVQNIFSGEKNSGAHQFEIDCTDLSKGIYLIKLQAGKDIVTKKLIVN